MIKFFLLTFLASFAYAEETGFDPSSSIIEEAALFFALFAILSIISFIVSKKSANKYEQENPSSERKAAARKSKIIERYLDSFSIKLKGKAATLLDISKHLENGVISEAEFEMLKEILYSPQNNFIKD